MSDYACDAVVIGAGVVGLAIARQLARAGRDAIILEKNSHIGMETSARNSEVIHAGLYYPKGSLKAQLCVRGKHLLYDFCAHHGVPHKRLGKLIVAGTGQQDQLAAIAQTARDNGVEDLQPLTRAQIAGLEPDVVADAGLFSPSTGIIDSHQYMLALLGEMTVVRDAEMIAARQGNEGWHVTVMNGGEHITLQTDILINAAGLWAQTVAARIEGLRDIPPLHLAKGNYAALSIASPFHHLVYPVPEPGGLGVHVTLDMNGRARFGPDVEWLNDHDPAHIDYRVSPGTPDRFVTAIGRYWPGITADKLIPDYSGVRPKLAPEGAAMADFRIDGPSVHGRYGLVNLFGIESPGLTASLAIAEYVETLL